MEFDSSFAFLLFSFSAFALFFVYVLRLRLKPSCNCDICLSYLTRSWLKEFDNLADWYTHLLRHSPTATIHVHVLGCIITANRENVEHMLTAKFDNYIKGKLYSTVLGDFLGKGIFVVDGEHWRFQRKMASLELGSVSVRTYALETVTSVIESRLIPLLSSFASKETSGDGALSLDLQDVFRKFSFDNICKFSFGLDPGCLELTKSSNEFDVAFDLASKLSAERALAPSYIVWKMKRLFNIGSEKQLKEAISLINGLAEDMIRQKRKIGFTNQSDLLSRFMGNTDDDRYLRDIIISFLLAGRDTVSSALTAFFLLLSHHPKVKRKIRNEIEKIMGGKEEMATYEELREMHYLNAALYETMRLLPPVQFDSKFSKGDDVLPDGTFVRKGTRVMYHPYAMGRMEELWGADCLEFKPQRWLNKDGVFAAENPFKYPVFQAGVRVCLGKEMAMVAMKSVALSLVRKFDIWVASPDSKILFTPGLTASLRGGLPVLIKGRST